MNNDEFVRRLIEAVRREPSLYDPCHEHYGNKHASAHFRAAIWQRLCKELHYPEDTHSLQMQWKRIRDKYVRDKRRKRGTSTVMEMANASSRHFNAMRWLDDYLGDLNGDVMQIQSIPSTSGEVYYEQSNHINHNGVGGGSLKEAVTLASGHSRLMQQQKSRQQTGRGTTMKVLKKNSNNNRSTNGSPSSSSSEISVGSAAAFGTTSGGRSGGPQQHCSVPSQAILLPQLRHLPNNSNGSAAPSTPNGPTTAGGARGGVSLIRSQRSSHLGNSQHQQQFASRQLHLSGTSQQHQQMMYKLKEEELGSVHQQHDVTTSGDGTVGAMTMIGGEASSSSSAAYQVISIPPTQHSSTSAALTTMSLEPSAIGSNNFFTQFQTASSIAQQPPSESPVTTASHPQRGRKRAAPDVGSHLQAHHQPTTSRTQLFIEQERIILNQPPTVVQAPMLVHHSQGVVHSSAHQMQLNPAVIAGSSSRSSSTAVRLGRISAEQHTATTIQPSTSLIPQPQQYILSTAPPSQQSQPYDMESSMIEMIVRHLGNLNDDEKVVTKMNIQRILMDARFGRGACVRMFREEEQSELSVEQQRQMQHQQHQQNSVNRR